ncbi:MAG: DUF1361 domain-containing protein [Bacteroidia bacterium]
MIAKAKSKIEPIILNGINLWLASSISFSFIILAYRIFITSQTSYSFLIWNLFLAGVPYVISSFIYGKSIKSRLNYKQLPLLIMWLLFLPNAPYILTDLFHLQQKPLIPKWYDLLLILSFALNGLVLGILSLFQIHDLIEKQFGKSKGFAFALIICLLCAFGVYLGRFLRFNSWDIISNPSPLFQDLFSTFKEPQNHGRRWGMTLVLGNMLFMLYSLLRSLRNSN